MTKAELRDKLLAGNALDTLFHFTIGQLCLVYKAECFAAGEDILYIPDIDLNGLAVDRAVTDEEELEDLLAVCYTGDDFVDLCHGDLQLAERLFHYCDWQHPSSALPELEDDG